MKSILNKTIGLILIFTVLIFSTVIPSKAADNDYTAEQNQKASNNAKIREIQEREKEVEKIKDETLKEVEKLNIEISQYEGQIEELDVQIDAANARIEEAQAKLDKAQNDYDKQKDMLEARLVAIYEAGETSYLDFLLSSENLTDLISNYYLATEIASYDTELLESIKKEKEEIAEAKETLEISKRELDTQKASKENAAMKLQNSKNSKNNYVSQLNEEEQQLQAKIDELKKDNESLDAEIRRKQAAIQEALRRQQANSGNNSSNDSTYTGNPSDAGFIKPVNSYVTTGMYYSSGGYHGAVDFGAAGVNGMPVVAVADGVVVTVHSWTTSYGNHVIIAHPNGLYTLYAHGQAGSICVSEGQYVTQGQQIMRVGSTGNSTGPHLHFEVRTSPGTYNNRVNPLEYLP
ncbi:MAG: peptidoglycan DD-metalloendopeptidase family protein [Clostridia bacterium]|nr:peptidoglycan DD-metalloendopeptidase family protein [Clostridia bacterium]